MWELWGVEILAFPLTWHIVYTTAFKSWGCWILQFLLVSRELPSSPLRAIIPLLFVSTSLRTFFLFCLFLFFLPLFPLFAFPLFPFFLSLSFSSPLLPRGGATILKVGWTVLRAERAKKFFWPPTLRLPGGTKSDYGMIMVISVWYDRQLCFLLTLRHW